MADRIVKPDTGNDLVLQNDDASAKVEINEDGTIALTGSVSSIDINAGSIDGVSIGTSSAVTDLRVDNLKLNDNEISSTNTDGDIDITPNGSGSIDLNSGTLDLSAQTVDVPLNSAVDALNFNTNLLSLDASNQRVGINQNTPTNRFHVSGANADQYFILSGADINMKSDNNSTEVFKINSTGTARVIDIEDNGTRSFSVKDGGEVYIKGNLGVGTDSPGEELEVYKSSAPAIRLNQNGDYKGLIKLAGNDLEIKGSSGSLKMYTGNADGASSTKRFFVNGSGVFGFNCVNDTTTAADNSTDTGLNIKDSSRLDVGVSGTVAIFNRIGSDGGIISLRQAGTTEGNITVSGTTVSLIGGHLSRWSYLPSKQKDESFLKGTVLTNLDVMCEWEKDTGEKKENEQLNQVNISTEEGDPNVAGVFVNWCDFDEAQYTNTHDLNMAMTGDMIIRIANGVTVEKGQLLMSAGDGTAKPQGDDIVKNKTIAKVTSNHVTCTYDDGSYCVPCVLMAC